MCLTNSHFSSTTIVGPHGIVATKEQGTVMKIVKEHLYQTHLQNLFDFYTNESLCLELQSRSPLVSAEIAQFGERNGKFVIVTHSHYRVSDQQIPSFLKKFAKTNGTMTSRVEWDLNHQTTKHANTIFEFHGLPVSTHGTVRIHQHGKQNEHCKTVTNLNVECSVPLLGKKISQYVAKRIESEMEEDYLFMQTRLGELYGRGTGRKVS